MDTVQIVIIIVVFLLLIIPMGKYLYNVISMERSFVDPVMDKIDGIIYKLSTVEKENMNWREYAKAFVVSNLVMFAAAFLILKFQGLINILNPNNVGNMETSLSFNTAASFVTNTDLQDYAGENGLSYLSQMIVITFLMFTSAASGFAVATAFIRGISNKPMGNFFVDVTRIITRVFLPLSIIISLVLISQGVPQTFKSTETVRTIENTYQNIALGPVASLESIKHLGTNGGGFFSANSAHPFENPNIITNLIETLSMMLLPGSLVYAFGLNLKNKKQGWAIFGAMAILFLIALPVIYFVEKIGNPNLSAVGLNQAMGNLEGKELRFGIASSAFFSHVTTAFTTGTVNNMHDSLMPLGGLITMWNMMLNVVFGGKGVGLMGMIMYAILTVFLCGLMVGRTPEFLGKKIEGKEMKLIATSILVHPILILIPTALALIMPIAYNGITNPSFHGLSQVLYQYTTSAANNGSGFEGLADNTVFWNTSTGIVMILGRYISMILLLAAAGSLLEKRIVPETASTFRTDNITFTLILVGVVLIIGALTFLPALSLGPVSEHLMLK